MQLLVLVSAYNLRVPDMHIPSPAGIAAHSLCGSYLVAGQSVSAARSDIVRSRKFTFKDAGINYTTGNDASFSVVNVA